MAELTLKLVIDPHTGKKTLVADYHSDEDALPNEHEEEHRRLVGKVLEGASLDDATLAVHRDGEQAPDVVADEGVAAAEAVEQKGWMSAIAFPSEEALVGAITAALLAPSELAGPVRVWQGDGCVWVRPGRALSAATTEKLTTWGARAARKRPPRSARAATSWLEAVRTRFVGEPTEPHATVLFALDELGSALRIAGEMLRLGCDRQRLMLGESPLLMVDAPPYFTVLRATEPNTSQRAFVPCEADRVWVELGHAHPLVDRIVVPEDQLLLVGRRGWQFVADGSWQEIDQLIDIRLPGGEVTMASSQLEERLEIVLRLTRTGRTRAPALWVVREDALTQVERVLVDLPTNVVDNLLFAVGPLDGVEAVVLRAREGASPMELALRAERYAPHAQLPSLWLPTDMALEPPLGRAHLQKLLAPARAAASWLRCDAGGAFTVEHAERDAFRPLADWVDYVVSRHGETITSWVEATVFDLDAIVRTDVVSAQRRRDDGEKQSARAPSARNEDDDATSAKERSAAGEKQPATPATPKKKARRKKKKKAPKLAHSKLSEAEVRRAETEQRFLQLAAPADADERFQLWLELGALYAGLGEREEASHAFSRVLWERGMDADVASTWASAVDVGVTVEQVIGKEFPSPDELRWLVARLVEGTAVDLTSATQCVDRHQENLDVRCRWLAHVAISQASGGDTLRLTRARDRALSDLRGGLSLDRDVPSFIRARATGHGDLNMARALADALETLWRTYGSTTRKRSAIEAPETVTDSYVRRLFAWGFARLGRADLVSPLLADTRGGADRADPVHRALLTMLDERVRQSLAGMSATTPLPGEVTALLNALSTFERYKVDRLREGSEILEPVERLDPAPGFIRGEADPRGEELGGLRALDAGPELSTRVQEIVRDACSDTTTPADRARLLGGAMDFFFALSVSHAVALLEELVPALEAVEVFDRALLVEEALVLAAHFGHDALINTLSKQLHELIGEVGEERAEEIGGVLHRALRTLRRVGLRDRAAALLEAVATLAQGDAAAALVARVHVAAGFIYLGARDRAVPLLESAHAGARDAKVPIKERLELVRALTQAAALLPAAERSAEIADLTGLLPQITDSFSTNTHFCLSMLHFLESLITGLVPPDRGRDGPAAAYLDEDEHLVRRRIHRELREAMP